MRLPLQAGFAWLTSNGAVKTERAELSTDQAIETFLEDLRSRATDGEVSKALIESQLDSRDRSAGGDAQALEKAIDTAGFDELFTYRLIPERYQNGRDYWLNG